MASGRAALTKACIWCPYTGRASQHAWPPLAWSSPRQGALSDGRQVMFDDNTGPALRFLWGAQRNKGPDVQYNHVCGDPRNLDTYTAFWNLCTTPAFLAETTDGSNHPEVVNLPRYRALDLFGYLPERARRPEIPAGYESLEWPAPPDVVTDLEALLRRRLGYAPKSRPSMAARQLGWLYSDGRPDSSVPDPRPDSVR